VLFFIDERARTSQLLGAVEYTHKNSTIRSHFSKIDAIFIHLYATAVDCISLSKKNKK
jgi:hypothetical protein